MHSKANYSIIEQHKKPLAVMLLGLMFMLGVGSMAGDSGIVDEVAHIPAGYSYLKLGDFRLNPEHPPLIKDLAAAPLLLMNLKFPTDIRAWTTDPNGQWEMGWHFIYRIGNDADKILFFSRLPILLLAILLGYLIYRFCDKRYGAHTALLALFLYALSPNLIAHSRLVTTDLGIAAFIFFAFYSLFNFFQKPSKKTLAIATVCFALMQLAKFSAVIMYPFFGLFALIAVIAWKKPADFWQRVKIYLGGLALIYIGAFVLVWIFYVPHTWNMPLEVQDHLINSSLPSGGQREIANVLTKINDWPGMKSIVHYILGVVMVFNRVAGGNTTYFLGEVTNQSFAWYFPFTYLVKTPIPELFLTLLALLSGAYAYLKNKPLKVWKKFLAYAKKYFVELSFLLFIVFYSYISITGNLNLGIRHLFPIFPFVMILVAKKTMQLIDSPKNPELRAGMIGALILLLGWYWLSNLVTYPSYIAYFNELIDGPQNAYKYVTDSNVDWGQDLKRLKAYVKENNIQEIAVDYFGGADPKYYFCMSEPQIPNYNCAGSPYVEWHGQYGRPDIKYIAVSETYLMNDLWWAPQRGDTGYTWLREMTPIAKIGYSIYVYKLK